MSFEGAAASERRQQAEQPDHDDIKEANEHDRREEKPRSHALDEFWHLTACAA
jgi:hypothetical protein